MYTCVNSLVMTEHFLFERRRGRGYGGTMTDAAQDIGDRAGGRGSRALWLDAARAAFLSGGVDAVKVQPLGAGLGLSRTSFYWFFKDRAALLDALLEDWEATNTAALVGSTEAYASSLPEAVLNLMAVFLDESRFMPRYETAIRGWAHRSAPVTARVNAADDRRLGAIAAMFARFGMDAAEADVRARTVYLVQMGYISLQTRETLDERLARVPGYVRTFAGTSATGADLARFRAGLGRA